MLFITAVWQNSTKRKQTFVGQQLLRLDKLWNTFVLLFCIGKEVAETNLLVFGVVFTSHKQKYGHFHLDATWYGLFTILKSPFSEETLCFWLLFISIWQIGKAVDSWWPEASLVSSVLFLQTYDIVYIHYSRMRCIFSN